MQNINNKLTKTQFKVLKKYDRFMKTARNGYVHGVYSNDVDELAPIYRKLGYQLTNPNCANCVLAMLINLSKHYYKYIDEHNEKE